MSDASEPSAESAPANVGASLTDSRRNTASESRAASASRSPSVRCGMWMSRPSPTQSTTRRPASRVTWTLRAMLASVSPKWRRRSE